MSIRDKVVPFLRRRKNPVTASMIMERFMCSRGAAISVMNKLLKEGVVKESLVSENGRYVKGVRLREKNPLYIAPVHASDTSQERVDETAKCKHEWVGLDGDIPGLGLVTEEFYNGMICAEDILRKKNT